MSEKQWVQHISGQGEKWLVQGENSNSWMVQGKGLSQQHWLPQSEYRLCDPPEVWRNVSSECEISFDRDGVNHLSHAGETRFVTAWHGTSYRLRKVKCCDAGGLACPCNRGEWVFIVEKKVS